MGACWMLSEKMNEEEEFGRAAALLQNPQTAVALGLQYY